MKTEKVQKASYAREVFDKLKAHKLAMLGVGVWILEILIVVFLPMIMNLDPYVSDYAAFDAAPSAAHPLGTDSIGRDLFARLIYGGRTSLLVGILSISLVIGVPLGLIAGYYRGAIEAVIMRVADVFMSFPSIVLILVLVSVLGPSVWSVTIVIGVLGWTSFARLIYANVLSVMEKEYVESARAVGTSDFWTIVKYILPNALPPILITVTFQTASAIITESSLSFLGMGVQPPTASLGNMLNGAQSLTVLTKQPWLWIPPGLMIVILVIAINFIGDALRDALDPNSKT